jgi:hypothetical protein
MRRNAHSAVGQVSSARCAQNLQNWELSHAIDVEFIAIPTASPEALIPDGGKSLPDEGECSNAPHTGTLQGVTGEAPSPVSSYPTL